MAKPVLRRDPPPGEPATLEEQARPADQAAPPGPPGSPRPPGPPDRPSGLGIVGWARWGWRQLTSMRTALVLLFLVAVGAVPGSALPQRGQAPEKVAQYLEEHKTLGPLLDRLSLFDVFAAPWFAAIYILLFVSLAGCVIPRAWRHFTMVRARPPAAPRHLSRLPQAASYETEAPAAQVLATAAAALRARRFRVDVKDEDAGAGGTGGGWVAAEKGYLRETGNLVFHLALLALLFAVGAGALYGYKGNVLLTEGKGFSNTLAYYDAFQPGKEFAASRLPPFSVSLDDFTAKYVVAGEQRGQPTDYAAKVRVKDDPAAPERRYDLRVNHPLEVGGAKVYLLGHGYAPTFTVRDGKGDVAFQGPVPFLPDEEDTFTSEGVIKAPDAQPSQLGFIGLFWPTAAPDTVGGKTTVSAFPAPLNPMVALFPFKGDLGLDSGVPQSVYKLEADKMRRIDVKPRPLRVGETVTLPDGAGSITYTGYREWVSLAVNHDPGRGPALISAVIAIIGLVASFLVRRRRVWVRAAPAAGGRTVVEAGGLTLGGPHPDFDDVVADLRAASDDGDAKNADKE